MRCLVNFLTTDILMRFTSIVILFVCIFTLISCNSAKDENTLIVGTSADNPPYEFIQNNQIVGLDIEIINKIAKHLGKNVVIENMDFNGLIAAIVSNKIDLAIASMSVTPERQAKIDFSDIYASSKIAVLYRTEDNFTHTTDLANKTIGALLGSIWSQFAKSVSVKYNAKVVTLLNNLALVEELKSGAIDAVIVEEAQAASFIEQNPNLSSFTVHELSSNLAIALPKKSPLKANIDGAIAALKADGTIDRIMLKWLRSKVNKLND